MEKLNALGIVTMLVNRVHSKIVIGDEGLLCIGSFNWFSATRDEKYKRYDTIRYDTIRRWYTVAKAYKRKLKRFIPAWNSGSYRGLKAMQVSNGLN
ncbi:hypothetical protein NUBL22001_17470 [Klebsiella pneumoniae]|nr:hypothetical protein NUBL21987_12520 [Klebsiella pneumoniae]GKN25286.1 hypothetical protein NUBL22001_17470 [Klebsiella pneumoniae]